MAQRVLRKRGWKIAWGSEEVVIDSKNKVD